MSNASDTSQRSSAVTIPGAIALYASSVLGGGILVLPGITASTAGPGALIAWAVVSIACLPIAKMFAKLSALYPDAGGVSTFVRRALGNTMGDITGWLYLWIIPVGQSAVVLSGLFYAEYVVPMPRIVLFGLALVILWGAALLTISGTRVSTLLQTGVVVLIVLLLVFTSAVAAPHIRTEAFTPLVPHGWGAIGAATALILWAYVGWENVSSIAEDFRNPKRDFAISVVAAVLLVGGLYALITAVVLGVLDPAQLASSPAVLAAVLGISVGGWAEWLAAVLSILIVSGSAMAFVWGGSSLAASLARAGSLPAPLARRSRRGAFTGSILMQMAAYLVVLVAMYFDVLDVQTNALIVGGSASLTYALAAVAYIILTRPRTVAAFVPPVLTGGFAIVLIPFFGGAIVFQVGIVAVYFMTKLVRKKRNHEPAGPVRQTVN